MNQALSLTGEMKLLQMSFSTVPEKLANTTIEPTQQEAVREGDREHRRNNEWENQPEIEIIEDKEPPIPFGFLKELNKIIDQGDEQVNEIAMKDESESEAYDDASRDTNQMLTLKPTSLSSYPCAGCRETFPTTDLLNKHLRKYSKGGRCNYERLTPRGEIPKGYGKVDSDVS